MYGPKHSKAWHTNFPLSVFSSHFTILCWQGLSMYSGAPPSLSRPGLLFSHLLSYLPLLSYTAQEKVGFERSRWFREQGQGYFALQSTKPQTVGYGLADSPVGLLAWIYEKLVQWTDEYPWDDDEGSYVFRTTGIHPSSSLHWYASVLVLTWISIYYFSRAGPAASLRIYYEVMQGGGGFTTAEKTTIPLGYSYFPKELAKLPRRYESPSMTICSMLMHRQVGPRPQPWYLKENIRAEAISRHTSSPRRSLEIWGRCLGKVAVRLELWKGRMDMRKARKMFRRSLNTSTQPFCPWCFFDSSSQFDSLSSYIKSSRNKGIMDMAYRNIAGLSMSLAAWYKTREYSRLDC